MPARGRDLFSGMITEAIILAGGLGTRLRSAVPNLPKCMAPVAGKPFLHYLINYFEKQGITRFIFSLGYMHEAIETFLEKEFNNSPLQYVCSIEDDPLGTGGAVLKAASLAVSEAVLVLNGDTFFAINLKDLSTAQEDNNSDCTLSLKPMLNSERYGVVDIDSKHKIISFREKQFYADGLINGGAYALNIPSFLKEALPLKFSFEKDYLESFFAQRSFYGSVQEGYFIDIGIPEDLIKANLDFKNFL
jgi:D-glycero-alpha-D-manno-heptose 1-phosphate guanylyltransferase